MSNLFRIAMFSMCLGMAACATGGSGAMSNNAAKGCVDAPLDGPDWKALGANFVADQKDKCGRTTGGTLTLTTPGASFEKSIPHMTAATSWYFDAVAATSCAEVKAVAGSPGGQMRPGITMGGDRYAAAGYVQSSELSVALLFKGTVGCTVKISAVHIGQTPPSGMEALPPAPGAPGMPTSPATPR